MIKKLFPSDDAGHGLTVCPACYILCWSKASVCCLLNCALKQAAWWANVLVTETGNLFIAHQLADATLCCVSAAGKLWLLLPAALKGEWTPCRISEAGWVHNPLFVVHSRWNWMCVRVCVCVFSAVLMHLPLSSLHPHSLTTLFLFFFFPFLCLSSLPRTRNPSRTAMVALGVSNLCFMLPWQFAQFVLLTQVNREQEKHWERIGLRVEGGREIRETIKTRERTEDSGEEGARLREGDGDTEITKVPNLFMNLSLHAAWKYAYKTLWIFDRYSWDCEENRLFQWQGSWECRLVVWTRTTEQTGQCCQLLCSGTV